MNIDIYSDRAKQAIQSAQSLALARRHQQLTPEHILNRLDTLCREALEQEPVRRMASTARSIIRYMPRADFAAMINSEFEAYRSILQALGVQPE